jgi:hypothetical protein
MRAPLKLCLVGDFYLVLRLGKLSELVTVAKSRLHSLTGFADLLRIKVRVDFRQRRSDA